MALSDEEQRLLDQMEAALAAEDPKLVNTLRGTNVRRVHRRRATIAGVAFFAGLALLVVGMTRPSLLLVSVLGFVVMTAAAIIAVSSWQHVGHGPVEPGASRAKSKTPSTGPSQNQGFMDRMEERWRRRRDEGF